MSLEWSAGSGSDGFLRLKLNHQYAEVNGIGNSFPVTNPEGRTFNSISFGPCLVNVATSDPTRWPPGRAHRPHRDHLLKAGRPSGVASCRPGGASVVPELSLSSGITMPKVLIRR